MRNYMENIKFSILIPAFKAKYLRDAIESCFSQLYTNWELVIVDDCSPENLLAIVKPYLQDCRVNFFRNNYNTGAEDVVKNWNTCLNYSTGDYVICMGDDDMLCPDCLSSYAELIKTRPGIGLLHARTEIIDENGDFLSMQEARPCYEGVMSLIWHRMHGRQQFIGDFCFKSDSLKSNGGFYYIKLAWGSDDISAVMAARENGVVNTQNICFQYRVNRLNITSSYKGRLKVEALASQKSWYVKFLSESDQGMNEIEFKYFTLVCNEIDQYFLDKIKCTIQEDLSVNFYNLFYWLYNAKKYNVSTLRVLLAGFNAFVSKFHGA